MLRWFTRDMGLGLHELTVNLRNMICMCEIKGVSVQWKRWAFCLVTGSVPWRSTGSWPSEGRIWSIPTLSLSGLEVAAVYFLLCMTFYWWCFSLCPVVLFPFSWRSVNIIQPVWRSILTINNPLFEDLDRNSKILTSVVSFQLSKLAGTSGADDSQLCTILPWH